MGSLMRRLPITGVSLDLSAISGSVQALQITRATRNLHLLPTFRDLQSLDVAAANSGILAIIGRLTGATRVAPVGDP
jgi:hypothetical protein